MTSCYEICKGKSKLYFSFSPYPYDNLNLKQVSEDFSIKCFLTFTDVRKCRNGQNDIRLIDVRCIEAENKTKRHQSHIQ